jgi:hypothetical protein
LANPQLGSLCLQYKRTGNDANAHLLDHYLRIRSEAKPRAFLLENMFGPALRGRKSRTGREYPEGWTIEVLAILADANTIVSGVRVPHSELSTFYVLSILEVEGDRIRRGREYWLDERQQVSPDDRARWFEPI